MTTPKQSVNHTFQVDQVVDARTLEGLAQECQICNQWTEDGSHVVYTAGETEFQCTTCEAENA